MLAWTAFAMKARAEVEIDAHSGYVTTALMREALERMWEAGYRPVKVTERFQTMYPQTHLHFWDADGQLLGTIYNWAQRPKEDTNGYDNNG